MSVEKINSIHEKTTKIMQETANKIKTVRTDLFKLGRDHEDVSIFAFHEQFKSLLSSIDFHAEISALRECLREIDDTIEDIMQADNNETVIVDFLSATKININDQIRQLSDLQNFLEIWKTAISTTNHGFFTQPNTDAISPEITMMQQYLFSRFQAHKGEHSGLVRRFMTQNEHIFYDQKFIPYLKILSRFNNHETPIYGLIKSILDGFVENEVLACNDQAINATNHISARSAQVRAALTPNAAAGHSSISFIR